MRLRRCFLRFQLVFATWLLLTAQGPEHNFRFTSNCLFFTFGGRLIALLNKNRFCFHLMLLAALGEGFRA